MTVTGALRTIVVLGMLMVAAPASAQTQPSPKDKPEVKSTLENLIAAHNGESNASKRYLAFAKKAEEEGYVPVASLFRAAARAEEVHAKALAAVIKKLGGTAEAKLEAPDVKTTRENVAAALKGETHERDVMYPAFVEKARQERITDAIRVFNYAKTAEGTHATFYKEALDNLNAWKGTDQKDFYVCAVCGYTVLKIDFEKCPSCMSPKDVYEKVN